MSNIGQFVRRMRRCYLKWLLSRAGYSGDTDVVHYLEGIRAEPIYEEMPLHYDLFDKTRFLTRSLSLHDLSHYLKPASLTEDALFIIGSGPSIKKHAIETLSHKNTILLNGAVTLIEDAGLDPLCVLIVDETFCRKRLDLLMKINPPC